MWKEVPLNDLCEYISRGVTPAYTDQNGMIVLNQKCIRDNRVSYEQSRLTNPEKKKIPDDKYLRRYDILINSTGVGTLGRIAQIKEIIGKTTVDSHVTIVRAKGSVNARFLGYNLFLQQPNIEALAEGSTGQTELSRIRLAEAIKVLVPTLQEQQVIADTLSCLDEKIELNRKINDNLAEQAQAIFKSWFVDFEPFQNGEFQFTESGSIPLGWRIVDFDNISTVQNGYAFKSEDYCDTGCKMIRTTNIDNGFVNSNCLINLPASYYSNSKYQEFIFKCFDTVLVMVGASVGKIGLVTEINIPALQNQNMWRFRSSHENISPVFVHYYTKLINAKVRGWSSGSARDFYRKDIFKKAPCILPPQNVMDEFNNITLPLFKTLSNNLAENERLAEIRNLLLPKLMAGDIDVSEIHL